MSVLAIFLASLLGSAHCAGMCGGFAMYCAGEGGKNTAPTLLYNVGRLFTYVVLGALAGAFGAQVGSLLEKAGLKEALPIGLGLLLVFWGLSQLFGWRVIKQEPSSLVGITKSAFSKLGGISSTVRAFVVGSLTTLLPCGWLYSFLVIAAATGSAFDGAVAMAVFWCGTLPMMLSIGEFSRRLMAKWGAQVPAVTAALLIAAGLFSLSTHIDLRSDKPMHCHGSPGGK